MATNLAGRGTDILLGGNPKGLVLQLLENKLLGIMAAGELLQYVKSSKGCLALRNFLPMDLQTCRLAEPDFCCTANGMCMCLKAAALQLAQACKP